jgi:hypothetical protein
VGRVIGLQRTDIAHTRCTPEIYIDKRSMTTSKGLCIKGFLISRGKRCEYVAYGVSEIPQEGTSVDECMTTCSTWHSVAWDRFSDTTGGGSYRFGASGERSLARESGRVYALARRH